MSRWEKQSSLKEKTNKQAKTILAFLHCSLFCCQIAFAPLAWQPGFYYCAVLQEVLCWWVRHWFIFLAICLERVTRGSSPLGFPGRFSSSELWVITSHKDPKSEGSPPQDVGMCFSWWLKLNHCLACFPPVLPSSRAVSTMQAFCISLASDLWAAAQSTRNPAPSLIVHNSLLLQEAVSVLDC